MNLFKISWKSLTFKRHISSIIRNAVLSVLGLAVFLIGYLIPNQMVGLYITGIVVMSIFFLMVLYELGLLLYKSIKANNKGKIVTGKVIQFDAYRPTGKYRLTIECETPIIVQCSTEPIFWPVDAKVLLGKQIKVIYFDSKSTCIVLPNE